MVDSLKASEQGLKIVNEARRKKRWIQEKWRQAAFTSISTLKRFLKGDRIARDTFINICEVVGVNWKEVAEPIEIQETDLPVVSPVKATPSIPNQNFVGREGPIAHPSIPNQNFVGRERRSPASTPISTKAQKLSLSKLRAVSVKRSWPRNTSTLRVLS
jgi:hypothetical protein